MLFWQDHTTIDHSAIHNIYLSIFLKNRNKYYQQKAQVLKRKRRWNQKLCHMAFLIAINKLDALSFYHWRTPISPNHAWDRLEIDHSEGFQLRPSSKAFHRVAASRKILLQRRQQQRTKILKTVSSVKHHYHAEPTLIFLLYDDADFGIQKQHNISCLSTASPNGIKPRNNSHSSPTESTRLCNTFKKSNTWRRNHTVVHSENWGRQCNHWSCQRSEVDHAH